MDKWIRVRYSEGPQFRKSTIPTNLKADSNSLTLILTLTLTLILAQTLALWCVSAQWTLCG